MKKIGKMVLMMMLAMPMLGINVTAATTENPDGRAVMNPCDDILQPGEYAQFSPRNSGMTSYRGPAFTQTYTSFPHLSLNFNFTVFADALFAYT